MDLPTNKVICHVDLDAFYAQVEVGTWHVES